MKICWMPLYPEWGASSRLRVWSIHKELLRRGYDSSIGLNPDADVLVVQKHQSLPKSLGKSPKIIYDGDDREVWGTVSRIVDRVDAVTTDTEGHKQEILETIPENRHSIVHVLPDTIDYFPKHPVSAPTTCSGVCWFGFYMNFSAAAPYLKELSGITSVRIISNGIDVGWADTLGWAIDTFISNLRLSELSLLSHSKGDINKSNNKMITSITWGLPCIVSDTPEYRRLAEKADVGWSVIHDMEGVIEAYERLKIYAERVEYLKRTQNLIWERYNIKATTDRFLELCNAL